MKTPKTNSRITKTVKNKTIRSNKTTSLKTNSLKTIKPRTTRPKTIKPRTINNMSVFLGTEGESDTEANLSFLIELLGSKLYETYVEDILNIESNQHIKVVEVSRPTSPPEHFFIPGNPIIFYGNGSGTHYTCTVDGVNLWNSYKTGIQLTNTDHFCQTFALMRMQYEFLPNSHIGQEFLKLQRGEYMDNAFIAKNVACDILELLNTHFDINNTVEYALQSKDRSGTYIHKINPKRTFTVKQLIKYCRSLTKTQLCNGTFYDKVFLI